MAAVIDIAADQHQVKCTDIASGKKNLVPATDIFFTINGDRFNAMFGTDSLALVYNGLAYSDVTVSGAAPASMNDLINKIGVLINF
jgi:hypothetical protein